VIRRPRLVFRIYLIGLAQVAALAFALWLARPPRPPHPPHHGAMAGARPPHPPPEEDPSRAIVPVGIVLVLVGVSAVLTAIWLGRPLARLSQAARELGAGKLSARANLRRNDELGDVSLAFDEMAERVAQLVQAQRELLANVSHELRTPLARIRVALDLAAEGDAEQAAASLGEIAGDLAELERLVADVLTSARLELHSDTASPPQPPLRAQRIEARELLDEAAARFRAAHPDHELVVQVATLGARLEADRMLLRRAIDNLLDNAAKHSESSMPVALTASTDGDRLWVEIRDRGRGLSPEDLNNLFVPFFRADRSRTRQTGGLGLGLVLARRIVEAHRGSLELTSAPQRGTVARVCVPLAS
jgi:two-component system, OmpR family, sensor kinase